MGDLHNKRAGTKYVITNNTSSTPQKVDLMPSVSFGNLVSPIYSANELGKRLLKAAAEGNVDELRVLLNKGAPFTADWLGTSPLHLAAQNNKFEVVEILLRAGISCDARTKVDRTPLHLAAYEGHVKIVEILLKSGADCDSQDMLHMTPLHWAAQNGHADVVSTLIYYGACTNLVNKFSLTASGIAAQIKRQDIVDIINSNSCNLAYEKKHTCGVIENDNSFATENSESLISKESAIPLETILKEESSDNSVISDTPFLNIVSEPETNVQKEQSDNSLSESMKILRQHGITMLPLDDNNILHSVVENGHSVVLTEIGKEVLNSVKPYDGTDANSSVMNKLAQGKTDNNNAVKCVYNSQANVLKQTNEKLQTSSSLAVRNVTTKSNKLKFTRMPQKLSVNQVKISDERSNLETVMKQLVEARKLIEEYKQKLISKEAEVEEYKTQLQLMKKTKVI